MKKIIDHPLNSKSTAILSRPDYGDECFKGEVELATAVYSRNGRDRNIEVISKGFRMCVKPWQLSY